MIQTDCFAYRQEKEECTALKELYYKKEKCKFYKTREQLKREQEKCIKN